MSNSILEQAKKRLAEIEEEAATLRRMIAAAEKGTVQVAPAPAPSYPPLPFVVPIAPPPTIWITAPPKPDHGGACACPSCVPLICGTALADGALVGSIAPPFNGSMRVGSTMLC